MSAPICFQTDGQWWGTELDAMRAALPIDARTERTDELLAYFDWRMQTARGERSTWVRETLCADVRACERHVLFTMLQVPHLADLYDVARLGVRLDERLRELTK